MIPTYLGLLGAFLVCLAYGLLQLNLNPKGVFYNLLNFVGSVLLGYSLLYNWNLGSFVIEVFWFLIACIGIKSAFRSIDDQASKSSYRSNLLYEPFGASNYKLTAPFTFYYYTSTESKTAKEHSTSIPPEFRSRYMITVPDTFITDFATIPRYLRFIFSPTGLWAKAAVLHDYIYRSESLYIRLRLDRKDADLIFLLAMQISKVPFLIRYSFYLAVRLKGSEHWEYYRGKSFDYVIGQTVILDPIILGYEDLVRMQAFEQIEPETIVSITSTQVTTEHNTYCKHALIPFEENL